MKSTKRKSTMVESDELLELTQQGIRRALDVKSASLTAEEIDQVSGGAHFNPVFPGPIIKWPFPFPWGIILRPTIETTLIRPTTNF